MASTHSLKFMLILTLAALSCTVLVPASPTDTQPAPVESTVPAPSVIPSIPALTADQLRNAQYQVNAMDTHPVVGLVDGIYQQGADSALPDYISVVLTNFVAVGDLDGDGVDEAAAIFVENFGGTGNFNILTLYRNENGRPTFVTSTIIDDRAIINSLSFEGTEIYLDAIVHGFEDPGCCPALRTTRRYALVNNQLRPTHFTSDTPGGSTREITINSPADGTGVTGSVQVAGDITIAPFENNLAYRIYDVGGTELAAGPVQVIAPDFGSPGTFNATIDLAGISAGTTIFLELQDLSAADGSLLAMDSVELVVK